MKNNMSETTKKIKDAIKNIESKNFTLLFFVYDTQGAPNGSLAYIYETAYQLKESGYKVKMLYADKEFVGVESWLGKKYASLPHELIDKDASITVSPADFLFIPELYTSVMSATKALPCKRIVIFQNLSYLADTCPMGVSFEDLKIRDFITPSEKLKKRIERLFPVSKINVVHRSLPEYFKQNKTKKLVIDIVATNQNDVNEIIKTFYWRFPHYKWVAFRPVSNVEREDFAKELGDSIATIWCDARTDCGQAALEAMAANSIVIGKVPNNEPDWLTDKDGNILNNGLWFYNNFDAADVIASVVESFIGDSIPEVVYDEMKKTVDTYSEENFKKELSVYNLIFEQRKNELEKVLIAYENKEKKDKEEK